MKPAEHRFCDDLSGVSLSLRPRCCRRAWSTLSNRAMRAPVVEIIEILRKDLLQLALIENEQVVQALGPDRSHPALRDCVGPRRSERGANLRDTEVSYTPIEDCAINTVAIMNEEA